MVKEWKMKTHRKDPDSNFGCAICGNLRIFPTPKVTRWYKLLTTTVYRCESHRKMIESPVYDQGKVSSRGELIGMEFNPTFEAGIKIVKEWQEKGAKHFTWKELEDEITSCKDKRLHGLIDENDPEKIDKIRKVVDHFKEFHPKNYQSQTYYDSSGEHNLFIEHPEQFFLTQISYDEVSIHYKKLRIPEILVGEDISAKEIRERVEN